MRIPSTGSTGGNRPNHAQSRCPKCNKPGGARTALTGALCIRCERERKQR